MFYVPDTTRWVTLASEASYSCGEINKTILFHDHANTGLSHQHIAKTLQGHFTFWISLTLRPKTETKPLNFGLSLEFRLSNHCDAHHCSVHSVIADISVVLCLFMN